MSTGTLAIYMPDLSSGGIERMHINLAPAFMAAGYEVVFVLQQAEGALMPEVPRGVRVVTLGREHTLSCIVPLAQFIKKEQPDILLSNLGHNNIAAIWANMLAGHGTRVIVSYHRSLSAESKAGGWRYRILPLLNQFFLKYADEVVAVSQGVALDLAASSGIAGERVHTIYNPVVFADFDLKMAEPATMNTGCPFILGVGRLVEQKDFSTLLAAFAQMQHPDLQLVLLGEGPLQAALEAQAQSLGVAERVVFAGYQSNPLSWMRKAKALVMSSLYEGFGNVLAEALACGTPVVSTDCPYGPAEILDNGKYGKLVPVGNSSALAKAISQTLENPLPRALLQARGREYTVTRCAEDYLKLFNNFERTPITLNAIRPAA